MASFVNGFLFKKVDPSNDRLMEMIYRLRFEVYARQCKFIREDDYPLELESDEYDEHSVHFAAINPQGILVATARMILVERKSSPLLESFPHLPNQHNLSTESIVEISRFMISKKISASQDFYVANLFSDRLAKLKLYVESKKFIPDSLTTTINNIDQGLIVAGLSQEIYLETKRRGIKYWCALMERGLSQLLKRYGIKLSCVGDDIDLFGPVRPYMARISDFEESRFMKFQPCNLNLTVPNPYRVQFLNN